MNYSDETREAAKKLYLRRYRVPDIVKELNVPRRTVYDWIKKGCWKEQLEHEGPLSAAGRRLEVLLDKDCTSEDHLNAIERAIGHYERLRTLEVKCPKPILAVATADVKIKQGLGEQPQEDEQEKPKNGKRKKRPKKRNNDFRGLTKDEIEAKFKQILFDYQVTWWENRHQGWGRIILKSRQIGATYYFAAEAFVDALISGENQIFISASRAQADVFKDYIKNFAQQWFGCEDLKGKDKITVVSDFGEATLYFLSTNSNTAQSYHGHLYIDEFFWIPKFSKLWEVAMGMASHDIFRTTLFSTPSARSHEGYRLWSGEQFNENRRADNEPEVKFPTGKKLSKGILCEDGLWRQVVTIHDAVKAGCDLFNIDKLRLKTNKQQFSQLYECQFIDDTQSVFQLKQLEKCLADRSDWRDLQIAANHPYGNRPVWIGYDPSRSIDGASIAVVAPPLKAGGKFRVLDKITMVNHAWQYQAAVIQELCEKYVVDYIGIDLTGPGSGVFELVKNFFPRATPINYSIDVKTRLVLKGQEVIGNGRIEWDASWNDIAAGFMSIRRTTTKSSQLTYVADRSNRTGHADSAWAILHALYNEGLDYKQKKSSTYDFGDNDSWQGSAAA